MCNTDLRAFRGSASRPQSSCALPSCAQEEGDFMAALNLSNIEVLCALIRFNQVGIFPSLPRNASDTGPPSLVISRHLCNSSFQSSIEFFSSYDASAVFPHRHSTRDDRSSFSIHQLFISISPLTKRILTAFLFFLLEVRNGVGQTRACL